jgi:DNA invertase Pin-like site-specific DNA recombinase
MSQGSQNYTGALRRAAVASDRIRALEDELRAEREIRAQAVVEAHDDEGHSYRNIARAIRTKYSTVYKIMTDWA